MIKEIPEHLPNPRLLIRGICLDRGGSAGNNSVCGYEKNRDTALTEVLYQLNSAQLTGEPYDIMKEWPSALMTGQKTPLDGENEVMKIMLRDRGKMSRFDNLMVSFGTSPLRKLIKQPCLGIFGTFIATVLLVPLAGPAIFACIPIAAVFVGVPATYIGYRIEELIDSKLKEKQYIESIKKHVENARKVIEKELEIARKENSFTGVDDCDAFIDINGVKLFKRKLENI